MAERDGLELPDVTMRGLFESGSMTDASAQAEAQRAAMLAIEEAEASRSVDDDILSRIGMLGEHPEQSLREAELLLAQDDFEGSAAASNHAYRAWTCAWEEGRRRALMAAGGAGDPRGAGVGDRRDPPAVPREAGRSRRPDPHPRATAPPRPTPPRPTAHGGNGHPAWLLGHIGPRPPARTAAQDGSHVPCDHETP